MAGITKTFVSGRYRLYRTFSFLDNNNKPQHNRKIIATYDKNNNLVFNNYFLSLLYEQNIPLSLIKSINVNEIPKYVNFGDNIFAKTSLVTKKITKDNKNQEKDNYDINIDLNKEQINKNKTLDNLSNCLNELNKIDTEICIQENENTSFEQGVNNINGISSIECKQVDYLCHSVGQKILFSKIINEIGLKKILEDIFPTTYKQILTLSIFLICENKALQQCHNWTEVTETFLDKLCLQSQRISELFFHITYNDIMRFHEAWASLRKESEYLALDVNSVSSWSKLIDDVELGYNRDHDNLAQINICMLFGEKSGLPVYMTNYPGSINDVKVLQKFIAQVKFLSNNCRKFVADKGFYSAKNIEYLYQKASEYKFLIAMPFTNNKAKKIIEHGIDKFDKSKVFKLNDEILFGYSFCENYYNINKIYYYIYFIKEVKDRAMMAKINDVLALQSEAEENPEKYYKNKDYTKYLDFIKNNDTNTYDILVKYDKIEHELRHSGWMIIVGNDDQANYKDVINIYRNKDVIEKSFNRLKNNLDLKRTKVHSGKQLKSKLFICFIALILNSYIHKVMSENKIYDKYTMNELLDELKKITKLTFKKEQFYNMISKNNRTILEYFNIKINDDMLNKAEIP
jgi:transposase